MANYAFIDGQNLYVGIQQLGWVLDYRKLLVYLKEKHAVTKAFLFVGYLPRNRSLYMKLRDFGYNLVFKDLLNVKSGIIKGNCDAELVLQAAIDIDKYRKAVLVSGDGDFNCLVKHLVKRSKFEALLVPNENACSKLLKKSAKQNVIFFNDLKKRLHR